MKCNGCGLKHSTIETSKSLYNKSYFKAKKYVSIIGVNATPQGMYTVVVSNITGEETFNCHQNLR